jgi:hypothetical protein
VSIREAYPRTPQAAPGQSWPPATPVPEGRLAVAVVLGASGSVIADAFGPYEVFARSPRSFVYTVSASPPPPMLSGGLAVVPDYSLDDVDAGLAPEPGVVVVPAVAAPNGKRSPPIRGLRQLVRRSDRPDRRRGHRYHPPRAAPGRDPGQRRHPPDGPAGGAWRRCYRGGHSQLLGWAADRGLKVELPNGGQAAGEFSCDAMLGDLAGHSDQTTARVTAKTIGYPTEQLELAGAGWPWRPTALLALTAPAAIGVARLPAAAARRNRR